MNNIRDFDGILVCCLIFLIAFGLLTLFSASYQRQIDTGKNFVFSQSVWLLIGAMLVFLITRVSYHSFLSVAYIIYGLQIFSLLLVLTMGKTALGAQRWINIGGIGFQPSEFAKIFTIIALARNIGDNPQRLRSLGGLFGPFFITLVPMVLIFKQPDLGTSMVFIPILLAMIWAGGVRLRYILSIMGGGLAVMPLFWHFLKDYQRDRLLVFMNPNLDPLGAGYTINQSKIAVGSGMLFGKGWLGGTQNQLNFLPERHTDFIFSVIGEEWGFVGAVILLTLFFIIILRGIRIAEMTNDISGRLIAVGTTTLIALHVIINIGMTLGLMPVVGMPLPFISYGGSAIITNLIAIGFLINIRMNRTVF